MVSHAMPSDALDFMMMTCLPHLTDIIPSRLSLVSALGALALISAGADASQTGSTSQTEQAVNLTVADYRTDLLELADRIRQEHPRPFRFISEDDFNALVTQKVGALDTSTTQRDFLWAFSEILSSIQCGHSRMPYFNQENALIEIEERFPVDVRFLDDRLYVLDGLSNAATLQLGMEITSINGRSVEDIRANLFRHIQAEGVATTTKNHVFNVYATSYLTYELGFAEHYTLTTAQHENSIALTPLTAFEFRPIIHPEIQCQNTLCYAVDQASNVGILTLRTFAFYGDQITRFTRFVDEALTDLTTNNRSSLIIDLRSNDGGSGLAGAYLLRRLAEAPFPYFVPPTDPRARNELQAIQQPVDVGVDLPVYLLVDGNTVSSAPHFVAIFQAQNMGTVLGEPMGGNQSTNDGKQAFTSATQGVQYSIATMRFDVHAPGNDLNQAIQPDIALSYTLEDLLHGEDSMMQATLERARGEWRTAP